MLYTADKMKAYVYAVFGTPKMPEYSDNMRYNPIYMIADCKPFRLERIGVVERIKVQQTSNCRIGTLEYVLDAVEVENGHPFPKVSPLSLVVILTGDNVSKIKERHMVHFLESQWINHTDNPITLNNVVKFRSEGVMLSCFEADPRLVELATREAQQIKYEAEHGCPEKHNYITINPDWDEEKAKNVGIALRAGWEKINYSLKKMGDEQKGEGNMVFMPRIEKVIFNDPATIVYWKDGTKTVVKANRSGKKKDQDEFREDYGLAMAIAKKYAGTRARFLRMVEKRDDGEWKPRSAKKDGE